MLPKIMQIVDEAPAVFDAADQILESVDWLCQMLTGERRRSASTAAYKAWWQEGEGYPHDVFAALDPRLAGLAAEKLRGPICPVGEKFGELHKTWAERLGLLPGTAVGCGIIDSHAGMPGCGITGPGQMMLIIGTSSVQIVLSEQPYSGGGIMGAVKGGIIPGYYALESGLAGVGDVFEWFIQNGVPARYAAAATAAGKNMYRYLGDLTAHYRAGQSGLLALDWLSGNKTPFVDADLSGLILGINLTTKPEDIYRALVEATGFGTRLIMEHCEIAGVPTSEIIACGGIAEKDPFLMQIFADITNREIKLSAVEQTAALGAAIYASVAAGSGRGGYDRLTDAAAAMSRIREHGYTPNPANTAAYSELYAAYKEVGAWCGGTSTVMRLLRGLR
jgi:L-ribulokinase